MNGDPKIPEVVIISHTRHHIIFDVRWLLPKWAITLKSAMEYDVPTMRAHLVTVAPTNNTLMDNQQWANLLGQMALDSTNVDDFNYVADCNCESGGSCCQGRISLSVHNNSQIDELPVYTSNFVSSTGPDSRVAPVHRTYSITAMWNDDDAEGVWMETDIPNLLDVGNIVTILDSVVRGFPRWMKVAECVMDIDNAASCHRIRLVGLGIDDEPIPKIPGIINRDNNKGEMVAHITNRQLLYYLAPGDTVAISCIVRKGTGRQHIKWSPIAGKCYYRPLYRDIQLNASVDAKLTPAERKDFIRQCPKQVFDIEDDRVVLARPDECDACRRCERWRENDDDVTIKGLDMVKLPRKLIPEWHRFEVRTNGCMPAADVVRRAFRIVRERLTGRSEAAGQQLEFPELRRK